ncbi:MAG: hypothetical protein HC916_19925 [Coleofasciculaceae cyanobacterium SM2_1_6]|nr:hypothetical protein [Coleofasciculaceae cyanobacterium SM2_1_6]
MKVTKRSHWAFDNLIVHQATVGYGFTKTFETCHLFSQAVLDNFTRRR